MPSSMSSGGVSTRVAKLGGIGILVTACLCAAAGLAGQDDSPEDPLAKARAALEASPDDPARLVDAAVAAREADRLDEALWYADLARRSTVSSEGDKQLVALESLDPLREEVRALFTEHGGALLQAAGAFERAGLLASAGETLGRALRTPRRTKARAQLDRMLADSRARPAAYEADVDLALPKPTARERLELRKQDARHAEWKNAWEFRGDHYVVRTNVGYTLGRDVLEALEQAHRSYVETFPPGAPATKRGVVHIHRNREGFLENAPAVGPTTHGIYVPASHTVALYDPRTEGRPLAALWSTLFHEMSHSFTHAYAAGKLPRWLDEGTACSFEGARVRPGGALEIDRLPERRLAPLGKTLAAGSTDLLRSMVTLPPAAGLRAEHYPLAWGLVYFLLHYEDDQSVRIYRPHYRALLESYRTKDATPPFDRFVATVVKGPADPEASTFEAFENRMRTWLLELHDAALGPSERARLWFGQARRQAANARRAEAVRSYRFALKRLPTDTRGHFELADVHAKLGRRDAALVALMRSATCARRLGTDDDVAVPGFPGLGVDGVVAESYRKAGAIGGEAVARLRVADDALATRAVVLARDYAERGLPLRALRLLDRALDQLPGDARLVGPRRSIRDASGADVRRWRRIPVDPGLAAWEGATDAWSGTGSVLRSELATPAYALLNRRGNVPFVYEATVRVPRRGPGSLAGLAFGGNERSELRFVGVLGAGPIILGSVASVSTPLRVLGELPAGAKEVRLSIEVRATEVEVRIDGKAVAVEPLEPAERGGRVGAYAQSRGAELRDLKLLD